MRSVRVCPFIFAALPTQYRTHNFAVVNDVFNALVSALGTFTNLFDQRISFLRMSIEVGVNI